ncbi:carbohydrate sulfotransferase 13-like isoform X2 [Scylla paramamosain]|uniref:carbohydrate sulfotransferase 13-like isoform X2 n=1 Tax=Scylla paramamosain TaxID=85552 RepID=UPI00308291DB
MVPSAKTCHRLLLFPTACMFVLFLLWIAQTDIDEKESRLSVIISRLKRPVDIFVFNNEGNQTLSAVDITPYMWTENATQKQTYASRNTSNGSIYGDRYSTTEAVYTESVQDDGVDEDFLREREKVFSERRQRIEKVCQQMGPVVTYGSVENTPLSRLRWLNARSLIMCFNAKVGTSSWSQYLLDVAKPGLVSTLKNIHSAAARLLVPPFGHSRLSKSIIRIYRPRSSPLTSKIPTFEEFVKFLISDIPLKDDIKKKHRGVQNIHWMPFYANCAPCDIHYDVILNMETIEDDTRYINHQFRLGLKQQLQMNHHAPNSSESSALNLFKELPHDLIMALHKRYRVDFDMFGYSTYPFLPEA